MPNFSFEDFASSAVGRDTSIPVNHLGQSFTYTHLGLERPYPPQEANLHGEWSYEQRLIDESIFFEGVGNFRCCAVCGDYKGSLYRCLNENCLEHELPMTGASYRIERNTTPGREIFSQVINTGHSHVFGTTLDVAATSQAIQWQQVVNASSRANSMQGSWG